MKRRRLSLLSPLLAALALAAALGLYLTPPAGCEPATQLAQSTSAILEDRSA